MEASLNESCSKKKTKKSKKSKRPKEEEMENESISLSSPSKKLKSNPDSLTDIKSEVNTSKKDKKIKKSKKEKKNKEKKNKTDSENDLDNKNGDTVEDNQSKPLKLDLQKIAMKEQKKEKMRLKKESKQQQNITDTETSTEISKSIQALQYLKHWKDNRNAWQFQKVRQTWLLKHFYKPEMIDDDHFKVLMKYMEGLKGNARDITLKDAEKIIEKAEENDKDSGKESDQEKSDEEVETVTKDKNIEEVPQEHIKRARKVIQLLSE